MSILKRISIVSGITIGGCYYFLHKQLGQEYKNIRPYELSPESRITKMLKMGHNPGDNYFAYCDTFKKTIHTSLSKEELNEKILQSPLLKGVADGSMKSFDGKITSIKSNNSSLSTLIAWKWGPPGITSFFETIAGYGYPWRLMNGGVHELLIISKGSDEYDIYFASAHEYKDLRDGKLIPRWVQALHRDYGRLVLELSTKV
jgi:hypothetical protein